MNADDTDPSRSAFEREWKIDTDRAKGSAKILVVEDDQFNQRFTLTVLRKLGHLAELVEGGLEAVARCETEAFDMILMDVHMAGLDGIEATRRIRASESGGRPRSYIVAITGERKEEGLARCQEAGMDDYLTKPYSLADLTEVLDRFFKQRGSE